MKQYIAIIMMVLFLAIIAGAVVYLSKRFAWYFGLTDTRPLYLLFAACIVYMITGVAAFTNSTSVVGSIIYVSAAIIMGFLLYLLLSVIMVDLIKLFAKVPQKWYGLAALSLAVLVSGYALLNAFRIRTETVELGIAGLKQEVRLMHLTDIHLGHFRGERFLQKIVDLTNARDVDMVLLTGDLYDGKVGFLNGSIRPLEDLDVPVYFVNGNHDGYSGLNMVNKRLKEIGVNVLENECVNMEEVQIIGLNHMLPDDNAYDMHSTGNHASIKKVLPGIERQQGKPTILMHHSPDGIQFAAENGVDLYLAGHTHAGQLFPVTLINELIFRYNKGLHEYNGTRIYVSHGAGTFGPPMRLGTRSEITNIILKPILSNE